MTKTSDYYYNLPPQLIAQQPVEPRDSSRLLVYNRQDKSISHRHFFDVIEYLNSGDVLVVNNTKVLPVRLFGNKKDTGAKIEFLLLKRLDLTHWQVILKPARKAKIGTVFVFGEGKLQATIVGLEDDGIRIVEFAYDGVFEDIVNAIGTMPLPPYITAPLEDKTRYNTVYSLINGSAAAPTAGLHFTKELLQKVKQKGIIIVEVLLHVGLGTFRPVKSDNVEQHIMHSEYYSISQQAADTINNARAKGNKVIAVGTTSVRVLESVVDDNGIVKAGHGDTSIFLYPPYTIKSIDGLITNFHLPESTLIMLVSCLASKEEILRIYDIAVEEEYRFFSFGDAMLIVGRSDDKPLQQ